LHEFALQQTIFVVLHHVQRGELRRGLAGRYESGKPGFRRRELELHHPLPEPEVGRRG
jgi:hypothetical protein